MQKQPQSEGGLSRANAGAAHTRSSTERSPECLHLEAGAALLLHALREGSAPVTGAKDAPVQASSASQKRNQFKGAHVFSQAAGHPARQVKGQIKQSRGRPCSHAAATVCAGKGGSHAGGSPSLRLSRWPSIPSVGRAPKGEMRYVFIILFGERRHRISVTFSRFRWSRRQSF